MNYEISQERKAFLTRDYSRGFIEYCQFKAEVIKKGYFHSTVGIEEHHRQQIPPQAAVITLGFPSSSYVPTTQTGVGSTKVLAPIDLFMKVLP